LGRQLNDTWLGGCNSRPESRVGFDPPQRCRSMGKIDVEPWETRIRDASPQVMSDYFDREQLFFSHIIESAKSRENLNLINNHSKSILGTFDKSWTT